MLILDILHDIVELVEAYWQAFAALGGFAAFLPALINLLKKLGVVGEGEANGWQGFLNAVLFVLFVGLRTFLPDFDVGIVDSVLAQIAAVLTAILTFLGQFVLSRFAYSKLWKGRFGWLGFYHS